MFIPDDVAHYFITQGSGNEAKVWLYHHMLASQSPDQVCAPSNIQTADYTRLSEKTVKRCKRKLIKQGIMGKTGQYRAARMGDCSHPVPVMQTTGGQNVPQGSRGKKYPEGFDLGSMVLGSVFPSSRLSSSIASEVITKPVLAINAEKRGEARAKPENLEPEPTPTPKPPKVIRKAPDGTEWPVEFNSWTNAYRLSWLTEHGYRVGGGKQERSKDNTNPKGMDESPHSAAPPNTGLGYDYNEFGECQHCGLGEQPCQDLKCPQGMWEFNRASSIKLEEAVAGENWQAMDDPAIDSIIRTIGENL